MPIVIDEVIISVEVTNHASGGAAATRNETEDRQGIVEECVERVLDVLRQKEER
jgi:hypothetical protein